jgi:hypothetical protein
MDDIDIRTYIGQENPTSDDHNGKAGMFSYMNDQSAWNGYYSHGNYECVVVAFSLQALLARGT